jgi:hypothetical protein
MDAVYSSETLEPTYKFTRRTTQKTTVDTVSKIHDNNDNFCALRFMEALLDLKIIWDMNLEIVEDSTRIDCLLLCYDVVHCVRDAT